MQKVVTITVPFSDDGRHYLGVSLRDGVGFELIDAPCGAARQLVSFTNAENAPTGIFWDGVTGFDDQSHRVPPGYLAINPAT